MSDPEELSVHDNFLVSYQVFSERREIVLHTEYRDAGEPFEFTDIVWSGVSCYHFEYEEDINIIFEIEEVAPEAIYRDHAGYFLARVRYRWPGPWAASAETAAAHFTEQGLRGFELMSTCGLSGWVIAREMRRVTRDPERG